MEVIMNGEKEQLADGATLLDMLRQLELNPEVVSIQLNGKFLTREELNTTLNHGDKIDMLLFMGGGC